MTSFLRKTAGNGILYMMRCRPSTPLRVTVMVSGVEPCLRHHLQGNHYQKYDNGVEQDRHYHQST